MRGKTTRYAKVTVCTDDKKVRCVLAGCPLARKGDGRCAACTGPVTWHDEYGKPCGRPRSCHDCPMDGLGLPVCWACCPGPNEGFSTDGQSMVTTGGMEAPSEFIARNAQNSNQPRRADSITATLTPTDEARAMSVLRRISVLDGRGWREFVKAYRGNGTEGRRMAARMIGASRSTFDADGSPQCRLVEALSRFDAEDFCILRQRMASANCSSAAATMLVTKQAVSKREKRMRLKAAWYGAFLDGGKAGEERADGERGTEDRDVFLHRKGGISPFGGKRSANGEKSGSKDKTNPHAHPHARDTNAKNSTNRKLRQVFRT